MADDEEESALASIQASLEEHWLGLSFTACLIASPLSYVALATSVPALALFVSSLTMLAAFVLGTLLLWPMEKKITMQRQLEVFGYRAGVGTIVYMGLGYGLLRLLNALAAKQIPLDPPPVLIRRLPFWPFYAFTLLGCQGFLPAPPGAC